MEPIKSTKKPTVREIAKAIGVCSMTVSLALRNHPKISLATRERVRAVAQQLGYTPDPRVSQLMHYLRLQRKPSYQSQLFAITSVKTPQENFYLDALLNAARERARSLGFGFEVLFVDDPRPFRQDLQRMLRSRGVEGILLAPMAKLVDRSNLFNWDDFSVVTATYGVQQPEFHRVVPRQFTNMMNLCQRLVEAGFLRIGLALSTGQDEVVHHHFTAAVAWQNLMGGTALIPPLVYSEDARHELERWCKRFRTGRDYCRR
ncbi:MAG: LacI family DNA-binding transcriptional regulator [Nibricoccus sp.]